MKCPLSLFNFKRQQSQHFIPPWYVFFAGWFATDPKTLVVLAQPPSPCPYPLLSNVYIICTQSLINAPPILYYFFAGNNNL